MNLTTLPEVRDVYPEGGTRLRRREVFEIVIDTARDNSGDAFRRAGLSVLAVAFRAVLPNEFIETVYAELSSLFQSRIY